MEKEDNDSELDKILQDTNNQADEALELFEEDDDGIPALQGSNAISDAEEE